MNCEVSEDVANFGAEEPMGSKSYFLWLCYTNAYT